MRILYASEGTSSYDELFVRYLLEKGHDVHLFTLLDKTRYKSHHSFHLDQFARLSALSGLAIHKMPFGHRNPTLLLSLKSLLRKIKPDVLDGNYLQTYAFYSAISNYHPFVAVVWGSDILIDPRESILGKLRARLSLKCADFVVVDSDIQKRAAIELGCNRKKIRSFPWCVDLQKFNPLVNGGAVRRKMNLANDDFVIICNRKHERKYGVGYLVRAIPQVVLKLPKARFLFLGEGAETERLRQLATELGLGGFVRFVGNVPHESMPQYLAASDLYVSPSLSDGTSASLLEAMASQKPVIATDIAGNREWIQDRRSGLLVPTANPDAIAKAIVALGLNLNIRSTYVMEALEIVKNRADVRQSLSEYEATLVEACNSASARL